MRRALACVSAALLLLAACSDEPELPPPAPALWEVAGPDGARGWLFGTAHALPDGHDWRTDAIDAAFAGADALVVEVDLAKSNQAYFLRISTTQGLGTPSSRVDPAHRARLSAIFAEAGLAEHDYRDTESWAVALALATSFAFGEGENGVDRALIGRMGAKRLVELEGFEGQFAVFDRLPVAEQVDMLEIVAEQAGNAAADGKRQIVAWRAGDIAALETEAEDGLLADPELREALLAARNRDWAEQVDRLLRSGETLFVAVGAAHLLGDEGLPALLEKRGFTVKRIQ